MKRQAGTVNENVTYSGVICELLDTLAIISELWVRSLI